MNDNVKDSEIPGYLALSHHMCKKAKRGNYPVTSDEELHQRAANGDESAAGALRFRDDMRRQGLKIPEK